MDTIGLGEERQLGSFEEIKMAVNPIIKLPQTKAMVFPTKRRKERKGKETWGNPTDLKRTNRYL